MGGELELSRLHVLIRGVQLLYRHVEFVDVGRCDVFVLRKTKIFYVQRPRAEDFVTKDDWPAAMFEFFELSQSSTALSSGSMTTAIC